MAKKFSTKALTKQVNKWTSGYYSSGYKSPYKSTYSNSSFWLDDDFLAKDDSLSTKEKATVNVVKLAAYKRAIGNFVRIVTNKDDIKVMYSSGNQSYTDGKQVVISAKLDEKEFDATVGLALHEGSHIALTDFTVTKTMLVPTNWFLDSLDEWHSKQFPGQSSMLYSIGPKIKDLVNIIEDRRIDRFVYDSAPGYQGYYKALYDKYFNAKEIDEALLSGVKCERTWDDYIFHIVNFANPNRQLNTLPALQEIWDIINIRDISRLKSTAAVFEVAGEVFKAICNDIGGLDAPQGDGQGDGQPEDTEQEDKTNPGDGGGADINEDEDENNEMGGAGADPNMDMQGESTSEDGGDAQAQQGKVDPKQAKKAKDLADAIQKQKDFLDGKIKKKSLTKSDANKVNAAAESNMTLETVGGDIPNDTGNTYTGRSTNCTVVKGISKTLIDSGLLGSQSQDPEEYKAHITKYGRTDYIAEGIVLGTLLGKRLKTRDEDRTLKTTRMETGRIDRRLVAELGFGNDHVFTQTIHNTVTPSLIHISVDASGSMSGKKWEASMKTSIAIAKAASMISSMDVVISARGTMGNYGNQTPLMWVVYDSRKDKFEQFKHKAYAVCAGGSTPEGLCFQAVMKEIIASANGKEMYFINISDGEPGYSDQSIQYGGDYANRHTKAQVDKMRANGIKVLSYFVSDSDYGMDRSRQRFQEMYGKNAEIIDINNLTQLSTSLNKLFVRNV
jgi:hypothetical protein